MHSSIIFLCVRSFIFFSSLVDLDAKNRIILRFLCSIQFSSVVEELTKASNERIETKSKRKERKKKDAVKSVGIPCYIDRLKKSVYFMINYINFTV